ncbi:MAG: hypothetical protein ACFE0P_08915 [Oceanicaulis sp.]
MTLFMLNHHDSSRAAIRDLAPAELDAIAGGHPGFTPGGCDQTTCETMTVTPNGDGGDISTDCDAG